GDGDQPAFEAHRSRPFKLHDLRNGSRQTRQIGSLRFELLPARARKGIELGAPVVFRERPLGGDPSLVLEFVQSRIERPFADPQDIARDLRQTLANRPTVHWFQRGDFQNEKVQRALDQIDGLAQDAVTFVTPGRLYRFPSVSKGEELSN